jgi:hypothetical protein
MYAFHVNQADTMNLKLNEASCESDNLHPVLSRRFQKMEQGCRKDLESLKSARRHGDPVPRFHYETRSFSVVQ